MSNEIVTLDVRPDLREGKSPFVRVMNQVSQLAETQDLLLLVPFEPVPLIDILQKQGFGYSAEQTGPDDWRVLFSRKLKAKPAREGDRAVPPSPSGDDVYYVDARNLQPPEPLILILEKLEGLSKGGVLRAHTDRRPIHLYAHLVNRGFTGDSEEQTDGSYHTIIRHCGA